MRPGDTNRARIGSIMGQRLARPGAHRAVFVVRPADDAGFHCRPFDPATQAWLPEVWVDSVDLLELPRGNPALREALQHRWLLRKPQGIPA